MKHTLRNWKPEKSIQDKVRNLSHCDMCSKKIARYAHKKGEDAGPARLRLCWSFYEYKYGSGHVQYAQANNGRATVSLRAQYQSHNTTTRRDK